MPGAIVICGDSRSALRRAPGDADLRESFIRMPSLVSEFAHDTARYAAFRHELALRGREHFRRGLERDRFAVRTHRSDTRAASFRDGVLQIVERKSLLSREAQLPPAFAATKHER